MPEKMTTLDTSGIQILYIEGRVISTKNNRTNGTHILFSFFLPIRLNLRGGHQTGFGIQVQEGG